MWRADGSDLAIKISGFNVVEYNRCSVANNRIDCRMGEGDVHLYAGDCWQIGVLVHKMMCLVHVDIAVPFTTSCVRYIHTVNGNLSFD